MEARAKREDRDPKLITARAGRCELTYRPGALRIAVERPDFRGELRRRWVDPYADALARSPDTLAVFLEFVEEVRRYAAGQA